MNPCHDEFAGTALIEVDGDVVHVHIDNVACAIRILMDPVSASKRHVALHNSSGQPFTLNVTDLSANPTKWHARMTSRPPWRRANAVEDVTYICKYLNIGIIS